MGNSRLHHADGKKAGLAASRPIPTPLTTVFGQPIAEPLRHFVGRYPYPARLNEFHLRRLRASNRAKLFGKGSVLFEEGTLPSGAFVVVEGRVKESLTSSQGKTLVFGFFGPGTALGLAATVLGRPHIATAEAVQETSAVFVPRRELIREMQSNPMAAWHVAQIVSESCCFLSAKIGTVELADSATQKMARCLLGLMGQNASGDGEPAHLDLNQETIAQMVGLSRETASRLLSRFRRKGLLNWTRSDCVIRNRRALERLADFPQAVA